MNLNMRVTFLLCLAVTAAIVFVVYGGGVDFRRHYVENEPNEYISEEEAEISDLDKCGRLRFALVHGKYAGKSYILGQESNKSHNISECTIPVVLKHDEKKPCGEKCANFKNVIVFDFVRSKIEINGFGIRDINIPKVKYLAGDKQLDKILPLGKGDHFKELHGRANILERILKCFHSGLIPVLTSKNLTVPFSDVLQWDNALLRTSESRENFGDSNYGLSEANLFELKRVGFLIYQRYFSSKERIVDFALAAVQHKLGHDPPFHQVWPNY